MSVNITGSPPLNHFLRLAVIAGVESAVQIHIDRGDDLNARDASGMTPLMLSAMRNKPVICRLLLNAGANFSLLDPSGRSALEIAIASGSKETAEILKQAQALKIDVTHHQNLTLLSLATSISNDETSVELLKNSTEIIASANSITQLQSLSAQSVEASEEKLDLSGWEAEFEPEKPAEDRDALNLARLVQATFTTHNPIDTSTDWEDIEVFLPDFALPLARSEDIEGRTKLRMLLLRALREGSVPLLDVKDLTTNEDRSNNPDAEAYLSMVINDLGAEVDERLEYANCHTAVYVYPKETENEEATLDEALFTIDCASSSRNAPLRLYQRDFQRIPLLTAEEEIQLGKDMEEALSEALDGLANWPKGIELTLAAGSEVEAGQRQLSSICANREPNSEHTSIENQERIEHEEAEEEIDDQFGETSSISERATFSQAFRKLEQLFQKNSQSIFSATAIRKNLADLQLDRRFLLELLDAADNTESCRQFLQAMTKFRKARDKMTAANLRLAFFHAKKFMHSGEPLDDLAQEGNIGLLKAVDRYDWRRGFRFSTYATWWIRQQISRYIAEKTRTIRVPVYIHEQLQKVNREISAFEHTTSIDALAERTGLPPHKIDQLLRYEFEFSTIDEAAIDRVIAPDAIDSFTSPDPADVVNVTQLNRALERYITELSVKNRKQEILLRMRFGIGGVQEMTLDEIGRRFEVTRERIRQIEAKALQKLRNPVRLKPFARQALGQTLRETPSLPNEQQSKNANEMHPEELAPQPAVSKLPSVGTLTGQTIQQSGVSKPTALNLLLEQAVSLGIPVEDRCEGTDRRIWINLVDLKETQHRIFARKLIELGFTHLPGKGFWK